MQTWIKEINSEMVQQALLNLIALNLHKTLPCHHHTSEIGSPIDSANEENRMLAANTI